MGAYFPGQEEGIRHIRGLHPAGKEVLMHHLRNSLCGALGFIATGDPDRAKECLDHMVEDLEEWGL
jgi:hypothetical protein